MDTGRRPLLSLYSKWDIYVLHQGIIVFLLANRTAQSVQIGCVTEIDAVERAIKYLPASRLEIQFDVLQHECCFSDTP